MALINAVITVDLASLQWEGTYKINTGALMVSLPLFLPIFFPLSTSFPTNQLLFCFRTMFTNKKNIKKNIFIIFFCRCKTIFQHFIFFYQFVCEMKEQNEETATILT